MNPEIEADLGSPMEEKGQLKVLDDVKVIPDWHRERRDNQAAKKGIPRCLRTKGAVVVVACGLAGVIASFIVRRRHGKGGSDPLARLLEKGLLIPGSTEPGIPQHLQGLNFVCSAVFDIEGNPSRYGEESTVKPASAAAVRSLLNAGAELIGRTTTEELNIGLLGDSIDGSNPSAPECSISGCSCGPALMVASGMADMALGADHLAGIRVQSAVFGLSAFRPTQAAISGSGVASIAGSLDSVAWLTSNPALHPQIAQAYQLPGAVGNFSNTELLQIVVASEVFQLFGETGEHLKRVALTASRRWAGPEMTANGFLITYLRKAVPSRSHFLGFNNDEDDVLEGIRRAAVTLQYYELLQQYGYMLEEPDEVEPSILEQLTTAQQVGEEEVEAAEKVKEETSLAMRSILRESVIIIPSLPFTQPAQGSETEKLKLWEKGTLQLAALATMTGCPQATLPVHPQNGNATPLGISLLSLPKSDQRLAYVTAAIAPYLEEASASEAESSPGETETGSGQEVQAADRKAQATLDEASKEQERLKQDGNAAFKSGKYKEAIEKYSLAIKANPATSVLYSNRAQALLKIGEYHQAEQDCNQALKAGSNAKTLLRRGTARAFLNDLNGAISDFKHVLALEPGNRQAKTELISLAQLKDDTADETGIQGLIGSGLATNRSDMSL